LGSSKKSRKKKSAGLMAIADDEPIPEKKQPAPPQAAAQAQKPRAKSSQDAAATQVDGMIAAETVMPGRGLEKQPFLTGVKGPKSGTWMISTFPYKIGRDDCDLTVTEPSISRKHAEITRDSGNQYFITDLHSSNGTMVDGRPIAAGEKVPLTSGTRIDLGTNVSFQFELK
jgi:pSer/pThr/pTyr-binding forkhead associated (FHA) protein